MNDPGAAAGPGIAANERKLTVVIPAHNPPAEQLLEVVEALRAQTLPTAHWELIVVDDGSDIPISGWLDVSWHPQGRILRSRADGAAIGLVGARLEGFEAGIADVFVFVDQDNVLAKDYLARTCEVGSGCPRLGAWGGQIKLKFERPESAPEEWLWPLLCSRLLEHDVWSNDPKHYESTPWGAGLCVRRDVLQKHLAKVVANPLRRRLDPSPERMGFGGDTDIVNTACSMGYGKGVFARLVVHHLIPAGRCTDEYFLRDAEARGYSEVLHRYVDEGDVVAPRNDFRFWIPTFFRLIRKGRLERKMFWRKRRGQFAAVREFSGPRS